MRRTLIIATALAIQAVAGHAMATEYTLSVPVQLKDLSPVVTHYLVSCNLWRKKPGGGNQVASSGFVGPIAVKGGTDTVQKVKFDYQGTAEAAPITYECNLQLCSSAKVMDCAWAINGKALDAATFPPWRVSDPEAAYSAGVEGPLPK